MLVYKFGGGTLKSAEAIKKMTQLIRDSDGREGLVVVISAFGKMTNAFEQLFARFRKDNTIDLSEILQYHVRIIQQLFEQPQVYVDSVVMPLLQEIENLMSSIRSLSYNEGYDQVIPYGELLSTAIVSAYWKEIGFSHELVPAPEIIVTDNSYRAGKVLWEQTAECIHRDIGGQLSKDHIILTQGFIGGDGHGRMTTLGREGSDYTAAIIGHVLEASAVVIWKDVPGVLSADPTEFRDPIKLDEISYLEAVELSYFGAKIIHPNTIKPLQNKGIPLLVKSIDDPRGAGTAVIERSRSPVTTPVVIRKRDQVLVSVQPRDFSFIMEDALSDIFALLAEYQIRVNLMQHGAVSISLVFNKDQEKLDALLDLLLPNFKVLYNTGLDLLTIRHYTKAAINEHTRGKRIYVQQQSRKTIRFVVG